MERGYQCLERGNFDGAVKAWAQFLRMHPDSPSVERVREGIAAARLLRTMMGGRSSD
jgi:cytochrome c-type biogenesis protein CcmH/NrfG